MSFYTEEQLHVDISNRAQLLHETYPERSDLDNWLTAERHAFAHISYEKKLSEEFIEKHFIDKVNWSNISQHQKLSESFIEKYKDKVNWVNISCYQKLSESFIEKHSDKVNWFDISRFQKLSESFIEKHSDKVNWFDIVCYQKLSESFVERHNDKANWIYISVYQKLSEEFIEKHRDKVDWTYISVYQKLSEEFRQKHNLPIPKDSWLCATKEEKLKYIKENTNYEIVNDEYILAYKSTRHDGYSVNNWQYQYEVGGTYEAHCDCNLLTGNSFGLSAWTKESALGYYDKGELYLVKIYIDDIGAIVHNNNKIRCFRLTVMEKLT